MIGKAVVTRALLKLNFLCFALIKIQRNIFQHINLFEDWLEENFSFFAH